MLGVIQTRPAREMMVPLVNFTQVVKARVAKPSVLWGFPVGKTVANYLVRVGCPAALFFVAIVLRLYQNCRALVCVA